MVIVGILLVVAFDLDSLGVAIVGDIPRTARGRGARAVELGLVRHPRRRHGAPAGRVLRELRLRVRRRRHTGETVDPDQELVGSGCPTSRRDSSADSP
ncbi:hypothetical protein NKG05_12440 [Oerskovia sp. M15]